MVLAVVGGFLVVSAARQPARPRPFHPRRRDRRGPDPVGARNPAVLGRRPARRGPPPTRWRSGSRSRTGDRVRPSAPWSTSSGDPVAPESDVVRPRPDQWTRLCGSSWPAPPRTGDYRADCRWPGEPSSAPALVSFTVGGPSTPPTSAFWSPDARHVGESRPWPAWCSSSAWSCSSSDWCAATATGDRRLVDQARVSRAWVNQCGVRRRGTGSLRRAGARPALPTQAPPVPPVPEMRTGRPRPVRG